MMKTLLYLFLDITDGLKLSFKAIFLALFLFSLLLLPITLFYPNATKPPRCIYGSYFSLSKYPYPVYSAESEEIPERYKLSFQLQAATSNLSIPKLLSLTGYADKAFYNADAPERQITVHQKIWKNHRVRMRQILGY